MDPGALELEAASCVLRVAGTFTGITAAELECCAASGMLNLFFLMQRSAAASAVTINCRPLHQFTGFEKHTGHGFSSKTASHVLSL